MLKHVRPDPISILTSSWLQHSCLLLCYTWVFFYKIIANPLIPLFAELYCLYCASSPLTSHNYVDDIKVLQCVITCCGLCFLEALCNPRDAALSGVRVEKKQVNSVSRLLCERVGSLYFPNLVVSI